MLYQTLLKTLSLVLLFNVSFLEAKSSEPHSVLSQDEWQKIQSQISRKLLPQANVALDQIYLKASNVNANDSGSNGGEGGDHFGIDVAIDGNTLIVGASHRNDNSGVTTQNNSGAAYVFVKENGIWIEQAYLTAPTPDTNNQFGISVDVLGDTIVVGEYLGDSSSFFTGAAYIYTRTAGNWTFQTKLEASNSGSYDYFGYTVSLDGNTLLVGAYGEDGIDNTTTNNFGAVYVFTGSGASWTEQAKLTADGFGMGVGIGDFFGYSVSLSGDTAVIGAYNEDGQDDGTEDDSGAAYVFVRSGSTWSQQAYLKASNLETNDFFGTSVGVFGNSIVVGATDENGVGNTGISIGAAYVFTRTGITWSEQLILRPDNADNGDSFGNSVAIEGNNIVVGAKREDGNGVNGLADNSTFNAGAAYLFVQAGASIEQVYLKASNTDIRDEFGTAVAISGDTVIIGAQNEDSAVVGDPSDNTFSSDIFGAGAAYVFSPSPTDGIFIDGFEQP